MDSRIALVTWEFFIRLLKRLRYDMFDVWLHENLKLMKRVTECSGHNKDCRLLGDLWVVTNLTVETPSDEKRSDGMWRRSCNKYAPYAIRITAQRSIRQKRNSGEPRTDAT